jgi:signal transduction histidine kinase
VLQANRLPVLLWPVAIAAVVAGYVLLFTGEESVPLVAVVNRAVSASFIASGLIAWQWRPHSRVGALMTATGFLYLAQELLGELDSDLAWTLREVVANWWLVPFAALVLSFPTGRLSARADRLIVWGFVIGTGVWQIVWLFFVPSPPEHVNLLAISENAATADVIDTVQRTFNTVLGTATGLLGASRWLRGAPPLRRLLLPTLAGSVAVLILSLQSWFRILTGEFMRPSAEITGAVLVSLPLAYLFGMLREQLARAGTADLVVALQQTQDTEHLGALLARAVGDPSLELVFWLPGFECYADSTGRPVALPGEGSGRTVTPVERDGEPMAAIVHDAALEQDRHLLEIVSAAAGVALERRRLEVELESRVVELTGSRARLVEAGDAARRRIERDLHDGAQQRLVSLAIALRVTEDHIRDDPETAAGLVAAARKEVAESLQELRELARGIHPAVLEHGLGVALESLAARSSVPVSLSVEIDERLPAQVELAAYFVACEALTNIGKYAQASHATLRVTRRDALATVEIVDDGVGGADPGNGSGLRGLVDRVEAAGGRLHVASPRGLGTAIRAELPCEVRSAAPADSRD